MSTLGPAADAVAPVLRDAVRLNQALLKRPFTRDTLSVPLHYNVWEYYRSALASERTAIKEQPELLAIDRARQSWSTWNDYCREVIWFGNKKGAYLYEHQSAGGAVAPVPSSAPSMAPSAADGEPENVEPEIAGIY